MDDELLVLVTTSELSHTARRLRTMGCEMLRLATWIENSFLYVSNEEGASAPVSAGTGKGDGKGEADRGGPSAPVSAGTGKGASKGAGKGSINVDRSGPYAPVSTGKGENKGARRQGPRNSLLH